MTTILIVEDDLDIHAPLKMLIEKAGYETLSAVNANDAKAIISSDTKLDLVFTDICLGYDREGGIEVGKSVEMKRCGTPVVYTSGNEPTPGLKRLISDGATFLAKPYDIDYVISQITYLLQKH